jgi:glycosyltransferase involved in cell wall biosynthesis
MKTTPLELSVIICTRNRAQSLKVTLDCLLASYRIGLPIEIVIVDNGSQDETSHIVDSYKERLPLRYLREEREGKAYCLNRILDEGGLGSIIAEIDDDMRPDPDWIQGVLASCERRPDADIFGGHVYVIWPPGLVPVWAKECRSDVCGWAFSAYSKEKHVPKMDRPIRRDRWPCGNHFWFRSRLLKPTSRFTNLWETAPGLLFDFVENGAKAIVCPEVAAGHRIQPQLLDESFIQKRASMTGWTFANIYLRPHRPSFKVSGALSRHPIAIRLYFLAMLMYFVGLYLLALMFGSKNAWFERKIHATHRIALYREMLHIAGREEPYRIFRRKSEHLK